MTRFFKISLLGVALVAILAMASLYALFHGYFDHGQFEIKRFQWSSANQVAMVAKRSDREALGGLDYFVLIGNQIFTPPELRHAYYSNAVVFSALTDDCLTLQWNGQNKLTIKCNGSTIDRSHINAQRQQIGNITISYENIALK
jgi:hypothetical protein